MGQNSTCPACCQVGAKSSKLRGISPVNTRVLLITALLASEPSSHHTDRMTGWGIQRWPFTGCLRIVDKVHLHVYVVSTSPMLGDMKE